jgi:hypothetical protein
MPQKDSKGLAANHNGRLLMFIDCCNKAQHKEFTAAAAQAAKKTFASLECAQMPTNRLFHPCFRPLTE